MEYNFLIIIVTLITSLAFYFKWTFNYWTRKGVLAPKTRNPFGNITNVLLQKVTFGEELKNVYDEFKGKGERYCGFYFFTKPILLLFDPELIRIILTKDFHHFTDHGNYCNEEIDPLSGNLFALKGIKWKKIRIKLTPTFTTGKMKMMFPIVANCSHGLIKLMDEILLENKPIDIKEVVGRYTTDIIGSCAFGIDCNSLKNPNSEFRMYGKKVFEVNLLQGLKNLLSITFPQLLDFFKITVTQRDVTEFFMNVVKETVNYRETNEVQRNDFMQLLIQLKNRPKLHDDDDDELDDNITRLAHELENDNTTLSIEEIAAQAFVFFLAGFETSSTTLAFCFYELVNNRDIQEKLRTEINDVLSKHDGEITYDAISEMTYMDKCIYETLRKYPPVPILGRSCTSETYKIPQSDLVLEKGSLVFLPILAIQNDPKYYPDPHKFVPERFSPENKRERHVFTWLPFGEGPRACIGLRFSLIQTKVALAVLIRKFRFSLDPKTGTPLEMDPKSVVLMVKGGIWLRAEPIV